MYYGPVKQSPHAPHIRRGISGVKEMLSVHSGCFDEYFSHLSDLYRVLNSIKPIFYSLSARAMNRGWKRYVDEITILHLEIYSNLRF